MKQCSKCGDLKPLSEYYLRKASRDGYHTQCKRCLIKQVSNNYYANPEPAKQRSKKWREENPDWVKQNNKNWAINNAEYKALKNAEWRLNNLEQHRDNSKNWAKENPDKRKANNYKRRALLGENGKYAISKKELQKIYAKPCLYCGSKGDITLDHVIPVKRGGTHSIGNLVPSCQSCNSSKGNKTITEWKQAKKKATREPTL